MAGEALIRRGADRFAPSGFRLWVFLLTALALSLRLHAAESISGQITNAQTSAGMVGIDLDVFDTTGAPVSVTGSPSGTGGNFTLTLPGPGTYTVRADPSQADGFVDQYYNQVFLPSLASAVTVNSGEARTGINFSLSPGFTISGQVTSAAVGINSIDMDVFSQGGEFLSGYPAATAGSGQYTLGALPAGTYFVRADPNPTLGQFYLDTFYLNQFDLPAATAITITNANRTGIDIAMPLGGAIAGTVTASSNSAPLPGLDMDLYDNLGNRMAVNATTDGAGAYAIGSVPAGSYRLRVDPTIAQGYPRTYYLNKYSFSNAAPITVTAGVQTSGIDFSLPQAGTIGGTIRETVTLTALSGIDLDIYDNTQTRVDLTTLSDGAGAYQIGPLAPGSYFVRADPDPRQGHQREYYQDKIDLPLANSIVVSSGANTPNIDFTLDTAGWIEGLVRNISAQPLSGIDLDIYDAPTGNRLTLSALTDVTGAYVFGPLAPGQYKLRCDPTIAQGFAVEYYNSQNTLAGGTPVTVAGLAGNTGINFTLDQGGAIGGRIVRKIDGQPLAGIDVDVFTQAGLVRMDQSAKSDAQGYYTVGPLPVGSYIVRADPLASLQPYLNSYYNRSANQQGAIPVNVQAGKTTNVIDFYLISNSAADRGWTSYK